MSYTLTQAQYEQLLTFSQQATQQATEVQHLLKSLSFVPDSASELQEKQDNKFIACINSPYIDNEKSKSCVPLVKQWDILDNSLFVERMTQLFTDALGKEHHHLIPGIFERLQKYRAVVAGSAALACILEEPGFIPGDIDIFFEGTHSGQEVFNEMLSFLTENVGVTFPYAEEPQFHTVNAAEHIDELSSYKNNLGIAKIHNCEIQGTNRRIQLILLAECKGLERTSIRTFIRKFDLSCCQVFFNGKTFFVRSLYRYLTAHKFMLVNKNTKAEKGSKLEERINKYVARGFKAYTFYPDLHSEVARDGLWQSAHFYDDYYLTLTEKYESMSQDQCVLALANWSNMVMRYKLAPKIGNDTKHKFSDQLNTILAASNHIPNASITTVFDLLFKIKDIRWLLLILVNHIKFVLCFSPENLKRALEANFARDNLQLFKNQVEKVNE
jgi:hypothetical protein